MASHETPLRRARALALGCAGLIGLAILAAAPAPAQTALPVEYLTGAYLADLPDDPDAALVELDGLLDRLAGADEADPNVVYDITRQQIDILIAAGRAAEAGDLLVNLADYATGYRAVLGTDPGTLLSEAADLFAAAGMLDDARAALEALLVEQRDGGLPGAVLAATHERLAALEQARGDDAAAAAEREIAAALTDPETVPSRAAEDDHVAVDVYYATDRARSNRPEPALVYQSRRAPTLDYGIATVTIPRSHRPGAIETPKIWRAEFGLSPSKHVVLKSVTPMAKDAFFDGLGQAIDGRGRKEVFVFIHGYNTSFEKAAKRAAQIAYDMHFAGLPVLYSWPSAARAAGYVSDAAVVRLSGRRLSRFLEDLVARTGAERVNIVAHSMGNRALTDALELMALRRGIKAGDPPVFGQVVFAAPDVDAGLFAEMVPTIRPLAERLTLYASEDDWALFASRRLHGNAPRAGQAGDSLLVQKEFDSVDMTLLGDDMLSHNYFSSALLDLLTLFEMNLDPDQRCGMEPAAPNVGGTAWRYDPAACEESTLLDLLAVLSVEPALDRTGVMSIVQSAIRDPALADTVADEVLGLLFQ